jgi:predicted Zn-dependent protease
LKRLDFPTFGGPPSTTFTPSRRRSAGGLASSAQEIDDLPDIADSAGALISPEQEKQLGLATMREIRRYAPIITDEEVETLNLRTDFIIN